MQNWGVCGLLIFFPVFTWGQHDITWLTDDPYDLDYYLSDTPYSINMDTTNLVLSQLRDVALHFNSVSVARIDLQLRQTRNTCVSNRMRTPERDKHNLFSLPVNIHPLARLYYNTQKVNLPSHLITKDNKLRSIVALLNANPGSSIAIAKGVSYGTEIDAQLSQLASSQVTYYSVDNRNLAEPKLLTERFVDVVLDYPSDVYKQSLTPLPNSTIASIPLEQEQQYIISHIACSRSEIGQNVIKQVNRILTSLYPTEAFLNAHLRHLPSGDRADLRLFYQSTFAEYLPAPVKVAVDDFPPFIIYQPEQAPHGLDITIIERISQETGIALDYLPCPFARCIRMLETGEADIYISLFHSEEREQWIHFIEPPITTDSPQAFYLPKDSALSIDDYDDLKDLSIGVLRDSEYFEQFDQDSTLNKIPVVKNHMLIDMLLKQRIDVVIGSEIVMDYLINKSGNAPLIKKAQYRRHASRPVYIGISRRSAQLHLLPNLERTVQKLKAEGVFHQIYEQGSSLN
ncbi:transporter substrate-binding domain-containing protein [Lacimicrobium sp. SS2-24]|uniref:transporter substrate-binding domain-containing protein n=1 Tax=Lacimicrobium sp. SS2-24 TaxID=2005569 RepID=UPI000B4A8CB3|nr:transporter substrate-binding domain-containing protein [Lacimicrobium sp. SS2-24]